MNFVLFLDDMFFFGLFDYVCYMIVGVFIVIFVIGMLCFCVCCCRKLCFKIVSLKLVVKLDMKRNLIFININKLKIIKVLCKKMKWFKYGNKVIIDDFKFFLVGLGIILVVLLFFLDLKDKVVGEKFIDILKIFLLIKEKKVRKLKKNKVERI